MDSDPVFTFFISKFFVFRVLIVMLPVLYSIFIVAINYTYPQVAKIFVGYLNGGVIDTDVSFALRTMASHESHGSIMLLLSSSVTLLSMYALLLYLVIMVLYWGINIKILLMLSLGISTRDLVIRVVSGVLVLIVCVWGFYFFCPPPPSPRFYCSTASCVIWFSIRYVCALYFVGMAVFPFFAAICKVTFSHRGVERK